MQHPEIIDRQASREMEEKIQQLVAASRADGSVRILLVAMAAAIQSEVTHAETKHSIPHSGGVDNIMRAVEHTLRGDPEMNGYVLGKLNHGADCLNNWMQPTKTPVRA